MEEELKNTLIRLEQKIDKVYVSAEKTRRYLLTMLIVTVVTLVLPLFGLMLIVPSFMGTYNSYQGALEGL
ncbi:MAG: hypothetical protein RI911_60 [Candidatus Parcubacteria bacterium]|jgi:type II secretory pathway component PulF